MPGKKNCIYCGGEVGENGYCTDCRLSQNFLKKAENTSLYYYNIGLERASAHNLTGAIEALIMSLRYNKTNVESRNLLGLIYYETGEMVEALHHWVMSMNYKPKDNAAIRYLKEFRDKPKAIERENEAARTFNIALDHAGRKEFDLAVIQLKKCISLNHRFLKAYLLMALIDIDEKRIGAAKKYISKVIAVDQNNQIALHFLRELGESEESINRLADSGREDSSDLFNYYGMEQASGERPSRKIHPSRKEMRRNLQRGNSREQNLARYSNIYMVVGIIIGIIVFYFLGAPAIRQNAERKQQKQKISYYQTLSGKNSEIESLNQAVNSLTDENKQFASDTDAKQKTIDNLNKEVESLKKNVENVSGNATPQDASGNVTTGSDKGNDSVTKNNANISGISKGDIDILLKNN